jgi:hypothetical protein
LFFQLLRQYVNRQRITITEGFRQLKTAKMFYNAAGQRYPTFEKLFKAEPALYEDLLVKSSKTWSSSLLNSVVTEVCRAIATGQVVGSLLYWVRSSLKFLLSPMVTQLLKTLVANYSMERIMELYITKGKYLHSFSYFVAADKDQQIRDQRQLVTLILQLIESPQLLNVLQLEDEPDLSVSMDYQTPSCLPLFSSLSHKLTSIYQKVLHSLHEAHRTPQAIHSAFTKEVQRSTLAPTINFIESKPHLKEAFEKVFFVFPPFLICTGFCISYIKNA